MSAKAEFGPTYQTLFSRVIRGLETAHGGWRAGGDLRATFDIDLVIAIKRPHLEPLVKVLRGLTFDLHLDDARLLLKVGNQIQTLSQGGIRLDLWLMRSEYDRVAFERRRRTTLWPGQRAWMVSAEDAVLSKLIAGRTKDWEDAIGVIQEQREQLDWVYVNAWAKRLELTKALARVRKKQV